MGMIQCPQCNGHGRYFRPNASYSTVCEKCNGEGEIQEYYCINDGCLNKVVKFASFCDDCKTYMAGEDRDRDTQLKLNVEVSVPVKVTTDTKIMFQSRVKDGSIEIHLSSDDKNLRPENNGWSYPIVLNEKAKVSNTYHFNKVL